MLNDSSDFLLSGDVARTLGVSYTRVQQLILRGRLRAVARTAGGIRLFTRADVERLREARERERRQHVGVGSV